MRLADAGPRTWLLAGVAGWAVLLWLLAVLGMGGRIARLPDDPNLLARLPQPRAAGPERIGPLAQYAEVGTRPLFSEDRRPQPFVIQQQGGEEEAPAFDFQLTSVLITPQVHMAIIQPSGGGESIRMKLGEAPDAAHGWRLVSVAPRSAVFEGPQGQKSMELRTYNGQGGESPTTVREAGATPPAIPVQPPAQATATAPASVQDAAAPAPSPPPATPQRNAGAPAAKRPQTGSDLPSAPMTPEAQMEAIRKRIEARRAQLREEARRQQQNPANK